MAEPVQTDKEQRRLIRMAETISKALPYMRRHNDATFVVKYGGHAMPDPKTGELLKVDLKQVGEPAKINVMVLEQLRRADVIPVVAPIGFGVNDELTYNINADTSAGAIAGAMKAKRLLFLTDVPGVLDKNGNLIQDMTVDQARALIADGTISGGMIPKVENCIDAVNRGVEAAVIMDGRVPHALLLEVFTEAGVGTMVTRS